MKNSNAQLKQKLLAAEACDIGRLKQSYNNMEKTGTDYYMASGVIITITRMDGTPIISPTVIADGLSAKAIEVLKEEIRMYQAARIILNSIKES